MASSRTSPEAIRLRLKLTRQKLDERTQMLQAMPGQQQKSEQVVKDALRAAIEVRFGSVGVGWGAWPRIEGLYRGELATAQSSPATMYNPSSLQAAEDAEDTTKLDSAMQLAEELEGFDQDESRWYTETARVRAQLSQSLDDVNEVMY